MATERCLNNPMGIMCTSEEMRLAYTKGIQDGSEITKEAAKEFIEELALGGGFICLASKGPLALVCERQGLCPANPRNSLVEMVA